MYKNDHFTKTGSGQTWANSKDINQQYRFLSGRWDEGLKFNFTYPNPFEFTVPPGSADGGIIVGLDVGSYGMTKDSLRMLCIPAAEGYGTCG